MEVSDFLLYTMFNSSGVRCTIDKMKTKFETQMHFLKPAQTAIKIFGSRSRRPIARRPECRGICRRGFCRLHFIDATSLAPHPATSKSHLGKRNLLGPRSRHRGGGSRTRTRLRPEEQFSTLKSDCDGANVVLIQSAGPSAAAGRASGIKPVLARAREETGALVLAFCHAPV